jgi:protocatechuate 3,4-dioxygenase beta subunit
LAAAGAVYGFQAAPPPAKGTIEGQVLSASGTPLKKANVRLIAILDVPALAAAGAGQPRMAPPQRPAVLTKETDDQGRFSFTGLEAARYQLSAERQGYLRQSYGARKYSGGGTPIRLGQDQHVKDVIFKLSPQAVIVGKVVDEDGDPVANVQVRAMKMMYRSGKKQWQEVNSGQSSDIGEYRIPSLEPGRYLVSTRPRNPNNNMGGPPNQPVPDTPELAYVGTYYPSTTDSANAVPVDVGPGGEIRGIDVRLVKTQVFRIRGRVVTSAPPASGPGRGGVAVGLRMKDGSAQISGMTPARPPENLFEIRGVPPGSYILFTQGGGANQPMGLLPVEVGRRHVDNVVLTVPAGADLPGSVKIEGAAAEMTAPNLSINLRPAIPMGAAPRAKAAADLTFTLKNVSPMHYSVNVSGLPDGCYVKSIRYAGQEVPEDGVDFLSAAPLEVTLSATAAEISGAIVDGDGKPVSNALVALVPKDGPASALQSRNTDENGSASFRNLKPGEYRLFAWEDLEPGAQQDPDIQKKYESHATAVKLEPGAKQAVQVKVIPGE